MMLSYCTNDGVAEAQQDEVFHLWKEKQALSPALWTSDAVLYSMILLKLLVMPV